MGWLDRIFGKRDSAPQGGGKHPDKITVEPLSPTDRFIHIRALNFFGLSARSPNDRYLLAWSDSDQQGSRGGHRESGHGRYILLEGDKLLVDGRAERPNDGRVANNGVFILNDWRFGDGLIGRFLAFRPNGKPIVSRDFAANLYNNGLADDGSLAVCQTCHADGRDSSVLAVFDLERAREIAAWQPESGWADHYVFPADRSRIELHYRDARQATYAVTGDFLDADQWRADEIACGKLWVIERAIKDNAAGSASWPRALLMQGLEAAAGTDRDNRARARALRLRGELFEQEGELGEALQDFDAALALDPAVGLKRKAAQLRKAHPPQ